MFFRITVWSGFAGWNHMKNKSEGLRCSWITAAHFLLCLFWDATDHSLIPLCCLCKSHVAGLISILLLGSGWTWSSLVVYINSDSEDYRVYAAMLCGSGGDTVTKPSEQTGLNQIYCICALHRLVILTFPLPRAPGMHSLLNSRHNQSQEITRVIIWWRHKCRHSTSRIVVCIYRRWMAFLFGAMLSIQITQSEGLKIYTRWRFKGWKRRNTSTNHVWQVLFSFQREMESAFKEKWNG